MMTDPVKRWNPSGVYVWTDPETADRRFCGACMQLRRKSQSRRNNAEKNKDFTKKP